MSRQQSLSETENDFFSGSERGIQKKVKINGVEVISTIAKQNASFNDIRDWWKAYLSQEYEAEVGEWSGKGTELKVAELFSGPGGLAQGVKSFCEAIGIHFRSIAAMDTNRDALRVYEHNHGTANRLSENTEEQESNRNWENHEGDVRH